MPLTTINSGAALVGRSHNQGDAMKTMRVKVLRPFYFNRTVQKLGTTVELSVVFALEMIAASKAERIEEKDQSAETEPGGAKTKKSDSK